MLAMPRGLCVSPVTLGLVHPTSEDVGVLHSPSCSLKSVLCDMLSNICNKI